MSDALNIFELEKLAKENASPRLLEADVSPISVVPSYKNWYNEKSDSSEKRMQSASIAYLAVVAKHLVAKKTLGCQENM